MNVEKDFVRTGEAAKLLQISYQTLYRWTRRGLIPHLMTPTGQFIYKKTDLSDFYSKHQAILKK